MAKVITRFPPSPTGHLQAGNVRTAIFNYLFSRKEGGNFILRIEDTDRERSKKEYEDSILETIKWLGLTWDAFYRQSENLSRHQQAFADLLAKDLIYISKETPTEPGQRAEVVRFRNPNTTLTFTDTIRGPITFDTTELGDFIIGRSIDDPLYHFGVVVDDMDEGVTHVIRGEDHISNTPRQILIQRALGRMEPPVYTHVPLVLAPDKSKLSKRKGAKPILHYRDEGYLPEAIINYLALLGWHPVDEKELFSLEELIEAFDLTRIQKGGGVFDETKLLWFNHEHIKRLSDEEFARRVEAFSGRSVDPKIIPLLKDRSHTLAEAAELLKTEFDFLTKTPTYTQEFILKGAKVDASSAAHHLTKAIELVTTMPEQNFTEASVKDAIFPYATEVGRGAVLWPMRVALSGREKSPDPFILAALLGKEETLTRLNNALSVLK
jgi:glutamyl-tRNA synthetase